MFERELRYLEIFVYTIWILAMRNFTLIIILLLLNPKKSSYDDDDDELTEIWTHVFSFLLSNC